ncbi:MAG: serine/threonine-protein kinase [Polyangiaceae bacterium]
MSNIEAIGKYRVIGKLGQGGMARVLLTVVTGMHGVTKLLVLKELRDDLAQDGDFVQMFLNEARLAARLNHPNVVQTYEVGQEGEKYFIAMEYLEGQPLHAILRRIGRPSVPLDIHLRVLIEMLRGLDYAHSLTDFDGSPLNVVHRDISPQNVFVGYDGQVKLVDFGIAKVAGANSNTQEGMFKGKLSYVAPEQVRCDKIDARADIFAVGVMLWEAIAGRRLVHKDEDERSIIARRVNGNDPKIKDIIPECPAELAAICDRALAMSPDDRFQTAKAFYEALEDYTESAGHRVGPREVGAMVSNAFQPDRAKVRALVDEQLKSLTENLPRAAFAITGTYANVSSQVSKMSAITGGAPGSFSGGGSGTDLVAASPVTPLATQLPPPRSRAPFILLGAVVVAGGITAAAFMRKSSSETAQAAAATQAPAATETEKPATAPPPQLPAPKPDGAMLSLLIRFPEGATAKLDGGVVDNPFKATVAKDGSIHTLEVSADGFDTEKRTLIFGSDIDLTVTLIKAKDKPRVRIVGPTVAATPAAKTADPPATVATPTPLPPPTEDDTPHARQKPTGEIDDSNPYKKNK